MERQNDGTNDADALSRPPRAGDDPPSTDKEHPPSTDHEHVLPRYNFNGDKVMKGIRRNGESGRKGFHPLPFLRICYHSTCSASKLTNWLWPAVPAAIAVVSANPGSPRPLSPLVPVPVPVRRQASLIPSRRG